MKVIFVAGPTASGKSGRAVEIAKEKNGAIISADSRQIYIGMDIGTAKVATRQSSQDWEVPIQYEGIDHYLIDIVYPDERYTLFDFKEQAYALIEKLISQGITPIVCGGTGLYLDALIRNYQSNEEISDEGIMNELNNEYEKLKVKLGKEEANLRMWKILEESDPESAQAIHPNNWYYTLRALEVFKITGKSKHKVTKSTPPPFEYELEILMPDRNALYQRIEDRIDQMLANGLIQETQTLLKKYPVDLPALTSLGYKEIGEYLRGETTLEEATATFKQKTRNYAKRQIGWIKNKLVNE